MANGAYERRLVASGLLLLLAGGASLPPEAAARDSAAVTVRVTDGVARPVEGQLEAYNAHDLERFLSFYAPDVRLDAIGPDSTKVVRGKDAMRQAYAFLKDAPAGFRAEIVGRTTAGRYVIDHERIVAPGRPVRTALAIYQVRDTLISRVWLLPDP